MARRARWQVWAVASLTALSLLAALFVSQNPLTRQAENYAGSVAAASAASYVTLRTLNAVLSTAQEIEVGGSLVVSGTAQPLKVLEPIDDTIERISGLVFAVMVFTGILAVAMGPVGSVGWALVTLAGALWLSARRHALGGLARKLASYGLFLALAVPLAFLLSSVTADRLTRDVWERHDAVIAEITAQVEAPTPEQAGTNGWWDSLQGTLGGIERYQTIAQNIYDRADELIGSFIAILSVFVFKILLLPVLLIGAFFVLARHLGRLSV